jgi:Flp pilus assembly protein TadG
MRAQGLAAFAVAVPALMGGVFAIVGIGFWLYAQLVVAGAAQEGARVAARETGTLVEGEDAARRFLTGSLGPRGTGLPIATSEDADVVVVNVSGQFPVAVMLSEPVGVPLHATARQVRERFRPGGS